MVFTQHIIMKFVPVVSVIHLFLSQSSKIKLLRGQIKMYLFSSVAQSFPTLCDPMVCSTPGFPVHHQLPELTQTHVH